MKKLLISLACILTITNVSASEPTGEYQFKGYESKTPHYKLFDSVDKMSVYKKAGDNSIECWIEFEKAGVKYSTKPELTSPIKFKRSPVRACMTARVAASYL